MKKSIILIICTVFASAMLLTVGFALSKETSPATNLTEERQVYKSAEEQIQQLKAEEAKHIEAEKKMTPEEKAQIKANKKAAAAEQLKKDQAVARERYNVLQESLNQFLSSHDVNNLSEAENIELITLQEEMHYLYERYGLSGKTMTAEEKLQSCLNALNAATEYIAFLESDLTTCKEEYKKSIQDEIDRARGLLDKAAEIRTRLSSGESAQSLLDFYYPDYDD